MSTTVLRLHPAPATQPAALDEATLEQLYLQARRTDAPLRRFVQPAIPLASAGTDGAVPAGAEDPQTCGLPDAHTWAHRLVPAVLECLAGLRPAGQLARMVDPAIRVRIARRGAIARRRGTRGVHAPRVLKVHTCTPREGVAEVSVVVQMGDRVRAIALRLEGLDDRWVMTSFVVG